MKKYLNLISICLFLVSTIAISKTKDIDCKQHRLYCKMVKFDKNIDTKYALELERLLLKKAKEYGMSADISLAILIQESGLRNVNTFKTKITTETHCNNFSCYIVNKEIKEVFDMSCAQININTARQFKFDVERLYKHDLEYILDCHFKLLKEKMKMCFFLEDKAFSCYHSTTDKYRLEYVKAVSKYL
jgi:hypothetical protein